MKKQILSILILVFTISSCNKTQKIKKEENTRIQIDSTTKDTSRIGRQIEEYKRKLNSKYEIPSKDTIKPEPKEIKPIFGYRFIIYGDFDGNGEKERLVERFYSKVEKKETNKFYENISGLNQLIELSDQKKPVSFVESNSKLIKPLNISSESQLLGLSYLKNEGDLNGDGTDEVSYVINWADRSNSNTWYLMTYKNNRWLKLYSFPIWDFQIPDLPKKFNDFGIFNLDKKMKDLTNDTINKRLEKELKNFKGLVKKIKTNKIQIIHVNNDFVKDTTIINLKRIK